jgi:hypothetical protein
MPMRFTPILWIALLAHGIAEPLLREAIAGDEHALVPVSPGALVCPLAQLTHGALAPIETNRWSLSVDRASEGFDASGRYVTGEVYPTPEHISNARPVIWDTQSGRTIDLDSFFPNGSVRPCAISPDGTATYVEVRERNGERTMTRLVRLNPQTGETEDLSVTSGYAHAEVSPDKKRILFLGEASHLSGEVSAMTVDIATGKVRHLNLTIPPGLSTTRIYWKISDDGSLISTDVAAGGDIHAPDVSLVWQVPPAPKRGRAAFQLRRPVRVPGVVLAMAGNGSAVLTQAPDGSRGLVATRFSPGKPAKTVKLAYSGPLLDAIRKKNSSMRIQTSQFSPNGDYVAAILNVEVPNSSYVETDHGGGVREHDGSMIDTISMIARWDLRHPREAPDLLPVPEVAAATWGRSSPVIRLQNDGTYRVVGANDQTVYLVNSNRTIARVARPPAHSISDALIGVGLSNDGSRVIIRDSSGVHVVPAPLALPQAAASPALSGSQPLGLPQPEKPLLALPAPRAPADPPPESSSP